MKDLIEALTIFSKYNSGDIIHCEHDVLMVGYIDYLDVSKEDIERLDELGFFPSDEYESFISYRFGSC